MIHMLPELPKEQCPFCKKLLKKYADILGYTVKDVEEKLPYHAPRKSWIAKSTKGGSQMLTHYFQCIRCYPMTKKGWKKVERRFTQKELDIREIGKK